MKAQRQFSHRSAQPVFPIRRKRKSFFTGVIRWGPEDWMCASASFSIYIGLFFLMFPPAHERDAIPLLIVSSCLSFVIAASGADWVQSLKIADIEETSGRFALRCFFMVAGPVVDFLVFGILLIVYSMCVAVIGLIGVSILGTGEIWIPVLLFGFLGLLYVGRAGLHIRNSVMDTYGQIF